MRASVPDRRPIAWEQTSAECQRCAARLAALEAELPAFPGASSWTPAHVTGVLCEDVPDLIERLLNHDYHGTGQGPTTRALEANRFFLQCLRFICLWLHAAPVVLRRAAAAATAAAGATASAAAGKAGRSTPGPAAGAGSGAGAASGSGGDAAEAAQEAGAASHASDAAAGDALATVVAKALPDLAAVFSKMTGATDRRAAAFFEAQRTLPERTKGTVLWPGGHRTWFQEAVTQAQVTASSGGSSSSSAGAAGATSPPRVPSKWLATRIRGVEEVEGAVDASALEEAMQRCSLLQLHAVSFCAMGGVDGVLGILSLGCEGGTTQQPGDDNGNASGNTGIRPAPLESLWAFLLPLTVLVTPHGAARLWLDSVVPRFFAGARRRILGLRDEEVKIASREQIARCVCDPIIVLAQGFTRNELEEFREELLLLFVRRRLQSPFLERRLKALAEVKDAVDRLTPRPIQPWPGIWGGARDAGPGAGGRRLQAMGAGDSSSGLASNASSGEGGSSAGVSVLTPSGLALWLADEERNGLLPILCGARAHPEVLRRAAFLLRFLARERLLTHSRLDMLWACGCMGDKHEGLTCCVLDLLIEISPVLDWSHVALLVEKVVRMPPHSVDAKFLRFLRDLLLAAVQMMRLPPPGALEPLAQQQLAGSAEEGSPLEDGLAFFWRCVRAADGPAVSAPAPSSMAVGSATATELGGAEASVMASVLPSGLASVHATAAEARTCFLDVLRDRHFTPLRGHYLAACWAAMRDGPPADCSLIRLFREILDTFPPGGGRQRQQDAGNWEDASGDVTTPGLTRDQVLQRLSSSSGGSAAGAGSAVASPIAGHQLSGFLLSRACLALAAGSRGSASTDGAGAAPGTAEDGVAESAPSTAPAAASSSPPEATVVTAPSQTPSTAVAASTSPEAMVGGIASDPEDDATMPAHLRAAAAALETLLYVLTESPLRVEYKDVEKVWRISQAASSPERDLVSRWLSRAAGYTFAAKVFNRPHWEIWASSDYVRFFQEVLQNSKVTDYAGMSYDGLVCFVNYMKLCNLRLFNSALQSDMFYIPETPNCSGHTSTQQHQGYHVATAPNYSQLVLRDGSTLSADLAAAAGRRFRVVRLGILGGEELWEMATQVRDPSVFEGVSDFLVSLSVFLHPGSGLSRRRMEVQTSFLQRCLRILEAGEPGEERGTSVHKALALLAKFIYFTRLSAMRNQVSASWPPGGDPKAEMSRERRARSEPAAAFHVAFRSEGSGTVTQRTLYFKRSATIAQLRSKLSYILQIRPAEIGLHTCPGMQPLDWDLDCLTLEECQVSHSLYATHARGARSDAAQREPSWQASERDIDTLLDLLTDSATGLHCESAVWAILSCLPVHEQVVGALTSAARWGLEFCSRTPLRPLAQLLAEDGRALLNHRAAPAAPSAGSNAAAAGPSAAGNNAGAGSLGATEAFRRFWHTKVWPHRLNDSNSAKCGPDGAMPQQGHRLLYALRIIYSLMTAEGAAHGVLAGGSAEDPVLPITTSGGLVGERWSLGFTRAGGLELLLGVLGEVNLQLPDALLCLSLLAECIRRLISTWHADAFGGRMGSSEMAALGSSAAGDDLDRTVRFRLPLVVPQLLEALLSVVVAEFEPAEVGQGGAAETPAFVAFSGRAVKLCSGRCAPEEDVAGAATLAGQPLPGGSAHSDSSICAMRILALLHLILTCEPSCVAAFCGFGKFQQLLENGLFGSDAFLREAMAAGVQRLCVQDPSDDTSLSSMLLTTLLFKLLPQWQAHRGRSDQLFGLIARLLQRRRSSQPAAMGLVSQPQPPALRLDDMAAAVGTGSSSSDCPPVAALLDSLSTQLCAGGAAAGGGAAEVAMRGDGMMLGLLQLLHSITHCFPHYKGSVSKTLAAEIIRCFLGPAAMALPPPPAKGSSSGQALAGTSSSEHPSATTSSSVGNGSGSSSNSPSPAISGGGGCGGAEAPLCRTSQCRQAALALLLELATDSPEGSLWVVQLLLAAGVGPPPRPTGNWRTGDWVIHPDTGARSVTGFVGLKNLGATCYMNSVLQQLFAHSEFRKGILTGDGSPAANSTSAEPGSSEANGAPRSIVEVPAGGDLYHQLRMLFSSLQSSQCQYFSPENFCASFRDWEGRPVNVLQQMDADEFLSLFMDQLEKAMAFPAAPAPNDTCAPIPEEDEREVKDEVDKLVGDTDDLDDAGGGEKEPDGASKEDGGSKEAGHEGTNGHAKGELGLLRKLFGGTLCTEIIPKTPGAARSERREDFLVLSLDVKGKPSIQASLAAFVEGETLEGDNAYFSEEAGCKVDAVKRTSIYSAPKTLIMVLKRFDFDLDTMQKVKLNDFCEFPMRLDMWPYMHDALDGKPRVDDLEHEYLLRGIVLHAGTSDSGHYSSLVKVAEEGGASQWYEFNDTMVTPFNEEDIPQEAFGAPSFDGRGAPPVAGGVAPPSRCKNAYLLFYEKASAAKAFAERAAPRSGPLASMQPATEAEGAIQESVDAANRHHWHTQAIFSMEYADFAWLFASNFYSSPSLLAKREIPSSEKMEKQMLESIGALKFMQLAQLRRDIPGLAGGTGEGQEEYEMLPLMVCHFVASYLFTVLARSQERHAMPEWCSLMVRMLQRAGRPAQRWFVGLLACHGFVRETFLECPVLDARAALLAVMLQALRWLYAEEAAVLDRFMAEAPGGSLRHGQRWTEKPGPRDVYAQARNSDNGTSTPLLVQIWATLMEMLPVALQPEAHANFAQFFELMVQMLRMGPSMMAWARKAGAVDELVKFALQDSVSEPLHRALDQARRWWQPNWLRMPTPVLGADVGSQAMEVVSSTIRVRPVSQEYVLGTGSGGDPVMVVVGGCTDDFLRHDPGPSEESFERQLHSDLAADNVELGPLWAVLGAMLEGCTEKLAQHSEETDGLLRRLVRLGGVTLPSCGPAGRLLGLLCRGDLARSQAVICRICERVDESDGRALRGALRMGTALIDLADGFTQQRSVFLLKSVLHVAKNNRKYFRTMQLVIHYIVKWCRRRRELPQWLLNDAGAMAMGLGTGQHRWLEAWLKENSRGGTDSWSSWQGNAYSGFAGAMVSRRPEAHDQGAQANAHANSVRWSWCIEMLPHVKKIVRGEPLPRDLSPEAGVAESDAELVPAWAVAAAASAAPADLTGAAAPGVPILSKVLKVSRLAAAPPQRRAAAAPHPERQGHMMASDRMAFMS